MESLRTLAYDVRRDLKQVSDDLEIPDAQLFYWVLTCANRLRMQHIVKRRSGAYLTTFVLDTVQDSTWSGRWYVVLPKAVYDIDLDGGIDSLSYFVADSDRPEFTRVELFRTDPSRLRSRNMSTYQRSRPGHPYFWREGSRLYLDQVDGNLVKKMEAKLYTTLPTLEELDISNKLDEPFDFPAELVYPLKRAVIDMGRFVLSLPGQHLVNDGTNRNVSQVAGVPERTMSVNDPMVNTGIENANG